MGVKKRVGTSISSFLTILQKDRSYITASEFIDDYLRGKGRFNQQKSGGLMILLPLKQRLYQKGIDGKGNLLSPYAATTIKTRKRKGYRTRPTSLRFSGDWYKSMYVYYETSKNVFALEIRNHDGPASESGGKTIHEKTIYLKKKYGGDILTLTKDEEKDLINDMQEKIAEIFNYDLSSLKFEIK